MNEHLRQSDVAEAERPSAPARERPGPPGGDTGERTAATKAAPRQKAAPERPPPKSFWTTPRLAGAGIGAAILAFVLVLVPGISLITPSPPKTTYTLAKATYGIVTVSVHASGTLAPRDAFDVVTETGGQVQSMAVKSGDRVVKGQVVAKLQSVPLREDLLRAQTALMSASADVKQADTEVAAAGAAAAHLPQTASVEERDVGQARIARAVARTDKLRSDLRAAESRVANVRAQMAKLDLRAPADGIVLKRMIEPGTRARLSQGQGVVTLTSGLSALDLAVDLPESDLGSVRAGQTGEFTVPAFPGRTFRAVVSAIDLLPKREKTETGIKITYPGTLLAGNPGGVLRPGMSASAVIIVAQAANVLVVPKGALGFTPSDEIAAKYPALRQPPGGARLARVWVSKDGALSPRDIVPGLSDGENTEVKAGMLLPGDAVVIGAAVSVRGEAGS